MRTLIEHDRLIRLRDFAIQTCGLSGDMAEFGVYQGGSAKVIAEACGKPLHLFDTFAGMPEDDSYAIGHKKGDFVCSVDEVKEFLNGLNVVYHVGFFPDTAVDLDIQYSFVHIDADIYQSTKAGIEYFKPRMVPSGVIVFDDYEWVNCPAVKELVHQHFSEVNTAYKQAWVIIK